MTGKTIYHLRWKIGNGENDRGQHILFAGWVPRPKLVCLPDRCRTVCARGAYETTNLITRSVRCISLYESAGRVTSRAALHNAMRDLIAAYVNKDWYNRRS